MISQQSTDAERGWLLAEVNSLVTGIFREKSTEEPWQEGFIKCYTVKKKKKKKKKKSASCYNSSSSAATHAIALAIIFFWNVQTFHIISIFTTPIRIFFLEYNFNYVTPLLEILHWFLLVCWIKFRLLSIA